jgi:hypothetical protein
MTCEPFTVLVEHPIFITAYMRRPIVKQALFKNG